MRLAPLTLIALIGVSVPGVAQDFLGDFERFVEGVLPEASAPKATGVAEPAQPTPRAQRPDQEAGEPPLPRPRPEEMEEVAPELAIEGPASEAAEPAAAAPERVYQTACPALLSGVVVGDMLEPIDDGVCAARSPLLVSAIRANGREIGFSEPVTTNCQMAGALADWLGEVDAYAGAVLESGVATLNTGTSMMCRNRYGAEDGFVSEHGFGNAVDVTGFTLENGEAIAVETDWMPATAPEGKLLRQAHGAACGRFTTVLGPEANDEHADHFHLDLGCHGQSCMAQICE